MTSTNKPHPPKPMYPMYPDHHKQDKPKPKKDGDSICLCFKKRAKSKSVVEGVRERVAGGGRLEFWSVYGVPYFLAVGGIISSILNPIVGLVFWDDCPAMPVVNVVLLGRVLLLITDAGCLFLMSAEAFGWSKSSNWIRAITNKVNWRIFGGITLALFFVWGTTLFIASNDRYTGGKPVSYDPKIPPYCHHFLYWFVFVNKLLMLLMLGSSVALFLVGSFLLLCLLCIISRFGT